MASNTNQPSVEALFKLASDTADLLVASSKSSQIASAPESLHNQLDIPAKGSARVPASNSIASRSEKPRVKIVSTVATVQSHNSGGQASADLDESYTGPKLDTFASGDSSGLAGMAIKKKRGRPPKIRTQVGLVHSTVTPVAPAVAPVAPVPEVAHAHRSQRAPKYVNPIPVPVPEAPAEKMAISARSARLSTDGISYRELAGTRQYRKRKEAELSDGDDSHHRPKTSSSSDILKRKYKKRDKSDEAHRGRKHSHSYLAEEPEKRAKRQYIKKSSKWNSLAKSSHLREERFLRVQKPDITIRPTATRYDPSRPVYPSPHHQSAYGGVSMPSIMAHDPRIPQMGLPPPGYPMHPYMIPQFMPMHPYPFGRYDYGPSSSMYAPADGDPYYAPHPGMPAPLAFMPHAPSPQMPQHDQHFGHHQQAVPVSRLNSAAFRQRSSLSQGLGSANEFSNPIPDEPSAHETSTARRIGSTNPGTSERGSLKRNRSNNDSRNAAFVELRVPDQPASAIALLPPLTETSAFRHISKSHHEVTAQRRRRHKLDKLVSGKPVLASSENGSLLSQPPVSLVDNDSDLMALRQLAPCSCKWTRSSYEQVLAQADALMLSTLAQGKSTPGSQGDLIETVAAAMPLASCFSEPAADSAVAFAYKLQEQERDPEVVQEFISATVTLLNRELCSLRQAIIVYNKSSEKFHQTFEREWMQTMSTLNSRVPIPEEFFTRIQPDANADPTDAAGRDNRKALWENFHHKMSEIVVAKNGLDVVMDGMKSIHKMGKSLSGGASNSGEVQDPK